MDGIQEALTGLGFCVERSENLSLEEMVATVESFAHPSGPVSYLDNGLLFFYYTGHGFAMEQRDYLLPVDFREGEENYRALSVGRVLEVLQGSEARIRVLALDFDRRIVAALDRDLLKGEARASSEGNTARPLSGTMVVYATSVGEVPMSDPDGGGVFTTHLIQELSASRVELGEMFARVQEAVVSRTRLNGQQQTPLIVDALPGKLYLRGKPAMSFDILFPDSPDQSIGSRPLNKHKQDRVK